MNRLPVVLAGLWLAVAACGGATTVAHGVSQERSGLLTSDRFDRPQPLRSIADRFEFNGDAGAKVGFVSTATASLVVGVHRHAGAQYRGWFAVTYDAYPASSTFHVRMTLPSGEARTGERIESVFAVQTASTKVTGDINYVVVEGQTTTDGSQWQIGYAQGRVVNARTTIFWSQPADGEPYRDITLQTDGRHRLTVWFGTEEVFTSDALDMHIQAPFQPYLEVQTLRASDEASFTNFWVTRSDGIEIRGLRPRERACLANIVCANASTAGVAVLTVPSPSCFGVASITAAGREFGPVDYSCGSAYRLRGS